LSSDKICCKSWFSMGNQSFQSNSSFILQRKERTSNSLYWRTCSEIVIDRQKQIISVILSLLYLPFLEWKLLECADAITPRLETFDCFLTTIPGIGPILAATI